jgi:CRISPR-associated endonuclease/helicase Cas3
LNLLADPTDGYKQPALQKVFEDEDIRTRLGQLQVTLVLARDTPGGVEPWAGEDGWQLSEVQISAARYGLRVGVDQTLPAIAAAKAAWPEWKRDRMILAPVAAAGVICEGLRYDSETGLQVTTGEI